MPTAAPQLPGSVVIPCWIAVGPQSPAKENMCDSVLRGPLISVEAERIWSGVDKNSGSYLLVNYRETMTCGRFTVGGSQ